MTALYFVQVPACMSSKVKFYVSPAPLTKPSHSPVTQGYTRVLLFWGTAVLVSYYCRCTYMTVVHHMLSCYTAEAYAAVEAYDDRSPPLLCTHTPARISPNA